MENSKLESNLQEILEIAQNNFLVRMNTRTGGINSPYENLLIGRIKDALERDGWKYSSLPVVHYDFLKRHNIEIQYLEYLVHTGETRPHKNGEIEIIIRNSRLKINMPPETEEIVKKYIMKREEFRKEYFKKQDEIAERARSARVWEKIKDYPPNFIEGEVRYYAQARISGYGGQTEDSFGGGYSGVDIEVYGWKDVGIFPTLKELHENIVQFFAREEGLRPKISDYSQRLESDRILRRRATVAREIFRAGPVRKTPRGKEFFRIRHAPIGSEDWVYDPITDWDQYYDLEIFLVRKFEKVEISDQEWSDFLNPPAPPADPKGESYKQRKREAREAEKAKTAASENAASSPAPGFTLGDILKGKMKI